jgi:hypothetical protein
MDLDQKEPMELVFNIIYNQINNIHPLDEKNNLEKLF